MIAISSYLIVTLLDMTNSHAITSRKMAVFSFNACFNLLVFKKNTMKRLCKQETVVYDKVCCSDQQNPRIFSNIESLFLHLHRASSRTTVIVSWISHRAADGGPAEPARSILAQSR